MDIYMDVIIYGSIWIFMGLYGYLYGCDHLWVYFNENFLARHSRNMWKIATRGEGIRDGCEMFQTIVADSLGLNLLGSKIPSKITSKTTLHMTSVKIICPFYNVELSHMCVVKLSFTAITILHEFSPHCDDFHPYSISFLDLKNFLR